MPKVQARVFTATLKKMLAEGEVKTNDNNEEEQQKDLFARASKIIRNFSRETAFRRMFEDKKRKVFVLYEHRTKFDINKFSLIINASGRLRLVDYQGTDVLASELMDDHQRGVLESQLRNIIDHPEEIAELIIGDLLQA